MLKSFVDANESQIEKNSDSLKDRIFSCFKCYKVGKLPRKKALKELDYCSKLTQDSLKKICEKHSIDFWLAFVRSLPIVLQHWNDAWIAYATLAIVKYSNWTQDTTLGQVKMDNQFGVVFSITEKDLFNCCDIATLSRILDEMNGIKRWLGKGANILHKGFGKVDIQIPPEVKLAVEHYERRRPHNSILADEALFLDKSTQIPIIESFVKNPLIILKQASPSLSSAIINKTGETFRLKYTLIPINPKTFIDLIRPYEEAIEDIFKINLDAIMHLLISFSTLLLTSILLPDDSNKFAFDQSPTDEIFKHKFQFMVKFYQKGFLRFPEDHLRESLSSIPIPPYSDSLINAQKLVTTFFSSFLLKEQGREKIDVASLQPIPLIYTSPSNNCYLDFLWVDDFLRYLIKRAREWFPSQHGDRFTLALKRLIKQQSTKAVVISQNREYKSSSGKRTEIDLLIKVGSILYVVECKAYAKSRQFWLGTPKAINDRLSRIKKAVNQAKKAANVLTDILKSGNLAISEVSKVEWVVCTPTQEFLKPLDIFGLLAENIPRVCTPEELINHLNELVR